MKFSKYISTCVAIALLASSLQAQTVRGNYIKNLPASVRSMDNGGLLTASQAHSDGIGVIIIDENLDNSAYNTLANKYAAGADKLIEHVLLTPNVSVADKALALSLLADIPDGTSCDDGNALTFNETYLIGVCQGGVTNGSSCDDGNALSFGETYLSGVCQGGVINGVACDDGNALTFGETYLIGVCQGGFVNGDACDDNNADTINDIYINGVCLGELAAITPTAKYLYTNGNGVSGYTAGTSVNAYLDAAAKTAGTALLNGVTGVFDGTYWKPQGDTTKVLSGDFKVQIPLVDVGGVAGNGLVYTKGSGVFASTYRLDTQFDVTTWSIAEMNSVNPRGNATNICESRGMLLPRLDETQGSVNPYSGLTYVPAGGAMGNVNGVPSHPSGYAWTSTSFTSGADVYWKWSGSSGVGNFYNGNVYVRCVR